MIRDKILIILKKTTGVKQLQLEIPENSQFGDYSTNVALKVKSQKSKVKSSSEVAKGIVEKLKKDKDLNSVVENIEVAGPGFINFFLSKEALLLELRKVIKEADNYGSANIGRSKNVLVEYSSPNIAKYFGIGHLRSTIIGQALYNLYKFLGYKTIGDNHIGDWGTQFGALLAQIAKIQDSRFKIQDLNISDLEKMYVEFNKKAEENPKLWEEARGWFKNLEEGDKIAREIWNSVRKLSFSEFDRIYGLLGVKIDNALGESFYEDKMETVIDEVRKKGISKKSEGAEIVEFPSTGSGPSALPPAMLLKSDGTTTYFTRDLATIKYRMQEFKPDLVIYEVGSEQSLHFKQVFETAKMLGWLNSTELVHVAHGLIRLPHGKMSTRYGQTVRLEAILSEAIKRASKIIEESETPRIRASTESFDPELKTEGLSRMSSGQADRGLSKKEIEEVSKKVGIGAIKYFDLSHHFASDIIFNWEKMFVLEGNSAPYLQYTIARTNSVLAKLKVKQSLALQAQSSPASPSEAGRAKLKDFKPLAVSFKLNAEELSLLRHFPHFPEVIADAARNYSPNLLCNYLFDLAQKFNAFYNKHRIIDPKVNGKRQEVKEFRVALTAATGQILKNGLNILGIDTPVKM